MGANFVQIGEEVVVDLTNDSVTPETLASGVTAHDKTGKTIEGTLIIPQIGGNVGSGNDIVLEGALAEASYNIKYKKPDGSIVTIGELSLNSYTNLFNPALITSDLLNKRVKSDGSIKDCIGHFVVPHILISDKVPFTDSTKIYVKGATFNKTSADNPYAKVLTYKNKAAAGANPYSGEYSGITYNVLGQVDEGNGVISISGDIVRQSFASYIKYVAFCLKVKDTTITASDIQNIVITIDEPIG